MKRLFWQRNWGTKGGLEETGEPGAGSRNCTHGCLCKSGIAFLWLWRLAVHSCGGSVVISTRRSFYFSDRPFLVGGSPLQVHLTRKEEGEQGHGIGTERALAQPFPTDEGVWVSPGCEAVTITSMRFAVILHPYLIRYLHLAFLFYERARSPNGWTGAQKNT